MYFKGSINTIFVFNYRFALEKQKRSVTFAGQPGSEASDDGENNNDQANLSETDENKEEADSNGDDDDDDSDDSDEEDNSGSDDSYSDLASENESENDEAVRQVEKTPKLKKESKPKSILKKTEVSTQ